MRALALKNGEPGAARDTFVVEIKMQQRATWQGTVRTADGREELPFRSVLEMLKIMDGAIAANHTEDE